MGFLDSYKRLEKLCGEMLGDDRRVSAYIDEMLRTPRGSYYVETWNEDLKKLKHYRWIRNQISHEPDCTEQNMCEPEDALWLDAFHSRIMNQTDPLALYRKATQQQAATKPKNIPPFPPAAPRRKPERNHIGCPSALLGFAVFLLVASLFLIWFFHRFGLL